MKSVPSFYHTCPWPLQWCKGWKLQLTEQILLAMLKVISFIVHATFFGEDFSSQQIRDGSALSKSNFLRRAFQEMLLAIQNPNPIVEQRQHSSHAVGASMFQPHHHSLPLLLRRKAWHLLWTLGGCGRFSPSGCSNFHCQTVVFHPR